MIKKLLKILGWALVALLFIIFCCNFVIDQSTEGKSFSNLDDIPIRRVGIILGTAKKLRGGAANLYYANRIKATIALYNSKKISYVLVSGDNNTIYYNEPKTIKRDLIKGGIPEERIFLDYAGFRTLDSMVRAKEVFGLEKVTVISQKFHNERAIYLAEKKGLDVIGFNANDVSGKQGFKVHFREYFARVKVFLDLMMNTQPKFYGDKIEIK